MSDWQVGDRAVKIKNNCSHCTKAHVVARYGGYSKQVSPGQVYTVVGFSDRRCPAGFGLIIDGVPNEHNGQLIGWCRHSWRKIRPDEQEACEPEFVTLLKRSKRKVSA